MSNSPTGLGKRTRRIPYKRESGGIHAGGLNSDINVTPLVDVCLVLLIIFMVVTPMLGKGRAVQLPTLVAADEHKEGDQVFVSVDAEGAWIEQDPYVDKASFLDRLQEDLKIAAGKAAAQGYDGPILFIKGDIDVEYWKVRTVMEWIVQGENLTSIALVVDLASSAGSPAQG